MMMGAKYEDYLLGTAFARPVIGRRLVEIAKEEGADAICPLIGDFLYNPKDSRMKRQALHAGNLNFIHPITGQTLTLLAPLPEDMLQFFQMVIS